MTDHFARLDATASSPKAARIAALHRLCDEDYAKGKAQRVTPNLAPSYAAASGTVPVSEPSDLDVALRVAQQLLDSDSVLSLREALRLLLRALGAEPPALRCPAAHPEDPTPCTGPVVVTILDAQNSGANGCEHHGARLLASLDGGRVYPLPDALDAPDGAAIRVFKAADSTHPFAWVDGPRTRPEQRSHAENRRGGEDQ
ncbi:hypothetical protein [Streptomyces sp. NPDC050164]|uniref:hypothetical protein n=1 Tax=Streptomyces sp. NPDC050164 TaxID=3365605 RepID=UPI0037B665A2